MSDDKASSETVTDSSTSEPTTARIAPTHGWLEQFKLFGFESIDQLKKVAAQGLIEGEVDLLIFAAKELMLVAQSHDAQAVEKLNEQLKAVG